LFLDSLKAELDSILNVSGITANKRKKQLEAFHTKISELKFFETFLPRRIQMRANCVLAV
ncbi:hypothetical protein, partial [Corynebacterium belfantii]|uniref:hypothetical protein n=1 Tax=Corynebacterium belfantii TaxID=2014537 RepID=UPI001A7E5471